MHRTMKGHSKRILVWSGIIAVSVTVWWFLSWTKTQPTPLQKSQFRLGASMTLRQVADAAVQYGVEHGRFPSSTPATGLTGECQLGSKRASVSSDWDHPTWQALGIRLDHPTHHSFRFLADGSGVGATFTAMAFGDLDCDGSFRTFLRVGEITGEAEDGWEVSTGGGIQSEGAEY